MSNIKPHDVHYIEAHRTRTALVEDPIEFETPWKREHFPRKVEHLPRIRDYLPESGELRHSYRKRAYLWE